jgi:hypothetical protein
MLRDIKVKFSTKQSDPVFQRNSVHSDESTAVFVVVNQNSNILDSRFVLEESSIQVLPVSTANTSTLISRELSESKRRTLLVLPDSEKTESNQSNLDNQNSAFPPLVYHQYLTEKKIILVFYF